MKGHLFISTVPSRLCCFTTFVLKEGGNGTMALPKVEYTSTEKILNANHDHVHRLLYTFPQPSVSTEPRKRKTKNKPFFFLFCFCFFLHPLELVSRVFRCIHYPASYIPTFRPSPPAPFYFGYRIGTLAFFLFRAVVVFIRSWTLEYRLYLNGLLAPARLSSY